MNARSHLLATPAVVLAAVLLAACNRGGEPCKQADLDQPLPHGMPPVVRITKTLQLIDNRSRLDPLPAGFQPTVSARQAWKQLLRANRGGDPRGGGRDELLLGLLTTTLTSRQPAWVLFSSHTAQYVHPRGDPSPDVKPLPNPDVCAFLDIITAVGATPHTRVFYGGSTTSKGLRPLPPTSTTPHSPPPGT